MEKFEPRQDPVREAFAEEVRRRLPGEIEKVTWPLEDLHRLRDRRLLSLLEHAKRGSAWHRERLKDIDLDRFSTADLAKIPPMTKDDLMDNWDEIACAEGLSLDRANRHLRRVAEAGPALLDERFLVLATGGSTGRRGVMVWDRDDFMQAVLAMLRSGAWFAKRKGASKRRSRAVVAARVGAVNPIHITAALTWLTHQPGRDTYFLPPSLPIEMIARELNALQPDTLYAYGSMLDVLAREAKEGRLRVAPGGVYTSGETVSDRTHDAVAEAFGTGIWNSYGFTECNIVAQSLPPERGLHLIEDLCVLEPVDAEGAPVAAGRQADRILLTNVVGRALPLIRYEVTDRVVFEPEPVESPWTGRVLRAIEGRTADIFRYEDGTIVHPHTIRTRLAALEGILGYQVEQIPGGLVVRVQCTESQALSGLREALTADLERSGLVHPVVRIDHVASLPRHPETQKLRQFVPLS